MAQKMVNQKNKQKKEEKIEGLGGWLIIPIIGLFATVILQLMDLIDTLLFYDIEAMFVFILLNALFIALAGFTLKLIFDKKKEAKEYAIAFYIFSGISNLIVYPILVIGSIIWLLYFLQSERVKNTFVN